MTEPLRITVTVYPGGITDNEHREGGAINLTEAGFFIEDENFPPEPPWLACWHFFEDEFDEAVRAEIERRKER